MKRIVYTRFDGGVSVCCPAMEMMAVMTCGGGWFDDYPNGVSKAIDREIEKQVNNGRSKAVTVKFIKALAFGGCTDAEYFEIIRDRDCVPSGTGCELWDSSEVPTDRWFRDAWHRSANGGPIGIDLEKARPIQASHIDSATRKPKKPDGVLGELLPFIPPPKIDIKQLVARIRNARDEFELRAVWPEELKAVTL